MKKSCIDSPNTKKYSHEKRDFRKKNVITRKTYQTTLYREFTVLKIKISIAHDI